MKSDGCVITRPDLPALTRDRLAPNTGCMTHTLLVAFLAAVPLPLITVAIAPALGPIRPAGLHRQFART
jgi:hypothetical protein